MKFVLFALALIALARASPIEQPSTEERSPRQFFYPQYYGPQQYFYPRAPLRYPYFFQPSAAYLQQAPVANADQFYVNQRAGETVESRQILNNLICSATSPLSTTFVCTTALPSVQAAVPTTAFQVCKATNNLNKATGTFQHVAQAKSGPATCSFYITLPDNTKKVSVTCSTVNLSDGSLQLIDLEDEANPLATDPAKDSAVLSPNHKLRVDYTTPNGADSFKCSWKSA